MQPPKKTPNNHNNNNIKQTIKMNRSSFQAFKNCHFLQLFMLWLGTVCTENEITFQSYKPHAESCNCNVRVINSKKKD